MAVAGWRVAFPRRSGLWTVTDRAGTWGIYDPEATSSRSVDPAADENLPALERLRSAGPIIGYRVGRRAVVATDRGFTKVVRPRRLAELLDRHEWLHGLDGLHLPRMRHVEEDGSVDLEKIDGPALHQILRRGSDAEISTALDATGRSLPSLHSFVPNRSTPTRSSDGLDSTIAAVARADSRFAATLAEASVKLDAPDHGSVLTHGDLHDKNLLFPVRDEVAMIDLDGLALGLPEHDIGNLSAHLRLRAAQGGRDERVGLTWMDQLYCAYETQRPLDRRLVHLIERRTWLRLAGIYHFRSGASFVVRQLLDWAAVDRGKVTRTIAPPSSLTAT